MHEKQDKEQELAFRWSSGIVCLLVGCVVGLLWYATCSSAIEDNRARAIGVLVAIVATFALNVNVASRFQAQAMATDEKPKDYTLTYLLWNCAPWGFAVSMVMGGYGVERRNDTLPLVLTAIFTAAAFLPFLVVSLIRRWRQPRKRA